MRGRKYAKNKKFVGLKDVLTNKYLLREKYNIFNLLKKKVCGKIGIYWQIKTKIQQEENMQKIHFANLMLIF